jgi:hypothetical protein
MLELHDSIESLVGNMVEGSDRCLLKVVLSDKMLVETGTEKHFSSAENRAKHLPMQRTSANNSTQASLQSRTS